MYIYMCMWVCLYEFVYFFNNCFEPCVTRLQYLDDRDLCMSLEIERSWFRMEKGEAEPWMIVVIKSANFLGHESQERCCNCLERGF